MGSDSQAFGWIRLYCLHSDIYQLPVAYFCWTTKLQSTIRNCRDLSSCLSTLYPLILGTASAAMWTLRAEGRLFHSGLPHKGINSLELAMEAIAYIQNKFYQEYPPVSLAWLSDEFGSVKMAVMMFSLFCLSCSMRVKRSTSLPLPPLWSQHRSSVLKAPSTSCLHGLRYKETSDSLHFMIFMNVWRKWRATLKKSAMVSQHVMKWPIAFTLPLSHTHTHTHTHTHSLAHSLTHSYWYIYTYHTHTHKHTHTSQTFLFYQLVVHAASMR